MKHSAHSSQSYRTILISLRLTFGIALIILMHSLCLAERVITLKVSDTKKQQIIYGMDYERLWFWYGPQANKDKLAHWSVVDCDIDFIRVAINSAYELEEGAYDLKAYTDKIIPMMQSMQAANPNIKFFASPRPLNEAIKDARWQPYPKWITGDKGSGAFDFDKKKCAEYLIRYIKLMKSYGFQISYMDITNEWNSVTPSDIKDIKQLMDKALHDEDIPKLIGPSTWNYAQGVDWLDQVNTTSKKDAIAIAASHNTDSGGSAQAFADKVNERWRGKDVGIWNTELHDWKGKEPRTEIPTSHFLFDTINAGFTGISGWLAVGTPLQQHSYFLNNGKQITPNVKYYIFKKLSLTSNNGHVLDIRQPSKLTSTVATIKDGHLTVWILNNSTSDLPVEVQLNNFKLSSKQVMQTHWNESLPIEGDVSSIPIEANSKRFQTTAKAKSLFCYEIEVSK